MIKVYKIIKASDKVNAELLFTKSLNNRTRDHSLKLVEHQIKAQMKDIFSLCSGYTTSQTHTTGGWLWRQTASTGSKGD